MTVGPRSRLGPYEVVESIGAGGMGEVWRARDSRLDRDVAIKVLPAGFADNEQFLQRFDREARTVSSLNHPNICTLHDVGHEDGCHFLVMELIEGETLADRLRKGPLPLQEVLRIGRQIASALDAAHRQGVVHRDLKPGNVMLTRSGAKLLDFGLAKTATEGPPPIDGLTSLPTEARPLTEQGTILGTFQYMAPEQLEGLEADARTDIFALGAVLYEMATGRRAFEGNSKTSLIAAIVSAQPEPISNVTPMSPPALDHVVSRCLRKDPDDRWQSALDIASELEWVGELGSGAGMPGPELPGRKKRERWAWGIAAAAVLLAAGTLLTTIVGPSDEAPRQALALSIAPPEDGVIRIGNSLGWGIVSPDGSRVAFSALTAEGQGLWIRDLDEAEPHLLPGTEDGFYPFWSPDGRWLAFFDQTGNLNKVEIHGGLPERICTAEGGRGGSWGEDGWILMTPVPSGSLVRVPASGGDSAPVTTLDHERGDTAHYWAQILPGGRSYLYFVRSSRADREGIYLGTLDDEGREAGRRRLVASSSSGIFVPNRAGDPVGHLLWARDGRLVARPFDAARGELAGEAIDLDVPVAVLDSHRATLVSASTGGVLVSSRPEPGFQQVVWFDRSGAGPNVVRIDEEGLLGRPTVAPDGRTMAYALTRAGDADLWLHDLETGASRPLTSGGSYDSHTVWSDDSRSLVYKSVLGAERRLRRIEIGSQEDRLIISSEQEIFPRIWTRSDLVLGAAPIEGGTRIAAVDLDDPSTVHLLAGAEVNAFTGEGVHGSPDGEWVTWIGGRGDARGAFVARIEARDGVPSLGARHQRIAVANPTAILWSPTGDELFVVSEGWNLLVVPVSREGDVLVVGVPEQLFRLPSPPWQDFFSLSPDGQRIYLTIEPRAKTRTLSVLVDWRARLGA